MERHELRPYNEALWMWFMSKAKLRTVYGAESVFAEEKFHKHLEQCGIDMEASEAPDVGTISEFQDTFSPNDEIEGIVVHRWSCGCKKWRDRGEYSLAILDEIKLSDIVYEVLQFGLGNHLLERVTAPEED
jgi:hypothetical protein